MSETFIVYFVNLWSFYIQLLPAIFWCNFIHLWLVQIVEEWKVKKPWLPQERVDEVWFNFILMTWNLLKLMCYLQKIHCFLVLNLQGYQKFWKIKELVGRKRIWAKEVSYCRSTLVVIEATISCLPCHLNILSCRKADAWINIYLYFSLFRNNITWKSSSITWLEQILIKGNETRNQIIAGDKWIFLRGRR